MPIPKFLGDIPRIFVVELAVEVDEGAEELEEAVELVFSWAADPLAAGAAAPVAEVAAPLAGIVIVAISPVYQPKKRISIGVVTTLRAILDVADAEALSSSQSFAELNEEDTALCIVEFHVVPPSTEHW